MTEWETTNAGPDHVLETLKTLFELAGDKVETVSIDKESIKVNLSEEVKIPITTDILAHVTEADLKIIEREDKEDLLIYFLRVYATVAAEAYPRFLILAPESEILDVIKPYVRSGGMYDSVFGMIVIKKDALDELSFIICGGSGFGQDPAAILISAKGYIGWNK